MPRSPEEAEKSADKLKLEGDARAAFVSRLTAGYVPPAATPAAPKVEAPAPVEKVEPKVEPKAAFRSVCQRLGRHAAEAEVQRARGAAAQALSAA